MQQNADYTSMTDEALALLVPKDANAYDVLLERYEQKLLRYVQRISSVHEQEAEDLLQEIFLKAYVHIGDFDPTLQWSSWIYRLARNTTISAYRKKMARGGEGLELDGTLAERIATETNLPKEADHTLLAEQIRKALAALPKKEREPLELFYFEEQSIREISDILRKPIGSIATHMRRGKARLRTLLQKISSSNSSI